MLYQLRDVKRLIIKRSRCFANRYARKSGVCFSESNVSRKLLHDQRRGGIGAGEFGLKLFNCCNKLLDARCGTVSDRHWHKTTTKMQRQFGISHRRKVALILMVSHLPAEFLRGFLKFTVSGHFFDFNHFLL